VTALPSGGVKQVLIVNGFDRHDRGQDFDYPYAYTGDGVVDRVWARYNNSFDYAALVHSAIHAARPGVHVAGTSNEAVISGAVNLTDYDAVIWILGNEGGASATAPVSRSLDATEQAKITAFINAGGNLFISGSEIGWDLDQQNNGRTFYESTLKGNYVADDAGTYTATADAGGIFAGMSSFVFSNGSAFSSLDGQLYNVEAPDVIAPQAGAISALTYSGGTGGTAAIQVTGTGGAGNIVMFGFPFEAMTNATRRQDAIDRVLDFFGVSAIVPENADFNSDTVVDAADWVIWRKHSGITSGATLAQGDANGDGAVDSTDYDIWRGQFHTLVDAGNGSAAETQTASAALRTASVSDTAPTEIAPAEISANDVPASDVSTIVDVAVGELTWRDANRAPKRVGAALYGHPANESRGDWGSLLTLLADRKTDESSAEGASCPKAGQPAEAVNRSAIEQLSPPAFGQSGRWKKAKISL
jgi:hypothetical protein